MDEMKDALNKAGWKPPDTTPRGGRPQGPRPSHGGGGGGGYGGGRSGQGGGPPGGGGGYRGGYGGGQGDAMGASLPNDLKLADYYDGEHLKQEVFIETARRVAEEINRSGMNPTALRKFFNMVKAIETSYAMEHDFGRVKEGLFKLLPAVEYRRERGIVAKCFSDFIAHHVHADRALRDERSFRGFVQHFQSVVAYVKQKSERR
ncbi:type III-A CRISPR-associated protein Csm2 [bacterium]|nr:type III-A CRISPR-associated protein Csm2 [bacterium]